MAAPRRPSTCRRRARRRQPGSADREVDAAVRDDDVIPTAMIRRSSLCRMTFRMLFHLRNTGDSPGQVAQTRTNANRIP